MATLPTRTTASFDAIKPVTSLVLLDNEFNQYVGASGIFNGGTTATKLLIKASDASDPPVDIDQTGAGLLARWKRNTVTKATITNDGSLTANGITGSAGVYTFGSIPVGPASNPTADNQLARKAYVDARKTVFSISFGVADPSTPTVDNVIEGMTSWLCPVSTSVVINRIHVKYERGSHTNGTSVTFGLQKRTAAASWADPATVDTIALDDTNNTKFVVYTNDITDTPLASGDTLIVFIDDRSGTVTERDVSVIVQGTQTVF